MNGIISEISKSRSSQEFFRRASTVAITLSLFSGFLAGATFDLSGLASGLILEPSTLHYQNLSWVSASVPRETSSPLEIKTPDEEVESPPTQMLVPFHLASQKEAKLPAAFMGLENNIERLRQNLEALENTSRDPYSDFKLAASQLRTKLNPEAEKPEAFLSTQKKEVARGLTTLVPVPRPTQKEPSQASTPEEPIELTLASAELTELHVAPNLSLGEKKKLQDLLLAQQVESKRPILAEIPVEPAKPKPMKNAHAASILLAMNERQKQLEFEKLDRNSGPLVQSTEKVIPPSGPCTLLVDHVFERPVNDRSPDMDIRICPERLKWISKNWDQQGWIKVEGKENRPTLTRQPAPNGGSTLLIDETELNVIALRSGVRLAKGMGVILGLVPKGYKIEFSGRSEETEYFESNSKKYFAILNVEPGAGVVDIVSEKSQDLNSTLFVPVLEDVVTYLDLVEPSPRDILVQVTKNDTRPDPDVVGLTVGLSTQSGIQAITQTSGVATLRNVRLVNGFPVFVDVSSKHVSPMIDEETGYAYRYELRDRDPSGTYRVNQITEKSMSHWLKQVQKGLSDQGAMVVGSYDRKHLDGFKVSYHAKVQPLTAKFGLEPINYSVMWDGQISEEEPLEGDLPRFMSVQVSEGLSQVSLQHENGEMIRGDLIPVSPRVVHVVSP